MVAIDKKVAVAKELEPRIHIKEFLVSMSGISNLQAAGLKAFVGDKTYMRRSEFQAKLDEYLGNK